MKNVLMQIQKFCFAVELSSFHNNNRLVVHHLLLVDLQTKLLDFNHNFILLAIKHF